MLDGIIKEEAFLPDVESRLPVKVEVLEGLMVNAVGRFVAGRAEGFGEVTFLAFGVTSLPLEDLSGQPVVAIPEFSEGFRILHQATAVAEMSPDAVAPPVHVFDEGVVGFGPHGAVEERLAPAASEHVAVKLKVHGKGVLPVATRLDHVRQQVVVRLLEAAVELVVSQASVVEESVAHCRLTGKSLGFFFELVKTGIGVARLLPRLRLNDS